MKGFPPPDCESSQVADRTVDAVITVPARVDVPKNPRRDTLFRIFCLSLCRLSRNFILLFCLLSSAFRLIYLSSSSRALYRESSAGQFGEYPLDMVALNFDGISPYCSARAEFLLQLRRQTPDSLFTERNSGRHGHCLSAPAFRFPAHPHDTVARAGFPGLSAYAFRNGSGAGGTHTAAVGRINDTGIFPIHFHTFREYRCKNKFLL
jgi:hypothetical protein